MFHHAIMFKSTEGATYWHMLMLGFSGAQFDRWRMNRKTEVSLTSNKPYMINFVTGLPLIIQVFLMDQPLLDRTTWTGFIEAQVLKSKTKLILDPSIAPKFWTKIT